MTHRRVSPTALLLLAMGLTACGEGSPAAPLPEPDPPPDPPTLLFPRDTTHTAVPVCPGGSAVPLMDIHFPSRGVAAGAPVALHLHGGGWVAGARGQDPWYTQVASGLIERGFVVATTSYRLAPAHPWPAQLHDAKCAVRHLRARAAEYGADPDRIVVWGHSAGAHLASMLGVTDPAAGFEGDGFPGVSSEVSGVVSVAGIGNLPALSGNPLMALVLLATFGTTDGGSDRLREASPVAWVSPGDAPHLLVHGDRDQLLPLSQATTLRDLLDGAGVRADLIAVQNGGHSLEPVGGSVTPTPARTLSQILDFMRDVR